MNILTTSLLLFLGLNQILARSVRHPNVVQRWEDYDYDIFGLPLERRESFFKFMMDADSDVLSAVISRDRHDNVRNAFFESLLEAFLENSEEGSNSSEKNKINSVEEGAKNDDNEQIDTKHDDDEKNGFDIILAEIFGSPDEKSSEEKNTDENNENTISAETTISFIKDDKSDESSKEKTPDLQVDIFDLADSSEEKKVDDEAKVKTSEETDFREDKSDENSQEATQVSETEADMTDMKVAPEEKKETAAPYDLSEKEILELASFFVDLNLVRHMDIVAHQNQVNRDDNKKIEEADEFLATFKEILDEVIEKNKAHKSGNADEKVGETGTEEKESDEDDNSNEGTTTTPKTDDKESDEEDEGKHNTSNEDDFNHISFVFHGIHDADEQQNLNDHKYSVIDAPAELQTTSAPFTNELASASTSNDENAIHEYTEIRTNLDTQQHFLQKHELDLDADFYAIISSNYDDGSLNKFEEDIYVVQENLDRIKRNINAMQNLQSKLYFHKLVTSAVDDIQNKPKN